MKLIITENQKFTIIKRYWDKLVSQGKDPSMDDTTLSLFHIDIYDIPDLQEYLVEYLGGYEVAMEKTIKILETLQSVDLDTGVIDSKWRYVGLSEMKDMYETSIGVRVVVFGEEVYDLVDEMDMSEFFDFKDYITDDIGRDLYKLVTTKTGVDIYISEIEFDKQ